MQRLFELKLQKELYLGEHIIVGLPAIRINPSSSPEVFSLYAHVSCPHGSTSMMSLLCRWVVYAVALLMHLPHLLNLRLVQQISNVVHYSVRHNHQFLFILQFIMSTSISGKCFEICSIMSPIGIRLVIGLSDVGLSDHLTLSAVTVKVSGKFKLFAASDVRSQPSSFWLHSLVNSVAYAAIFSKSSAFIVLSLFYIMFLWGYYFIDTNRC